MDSCYDAGPSHSSGDQSRIVSVTSQPPRLVALATAAPATVVEQENVRDAVAALFGGATASNRRLLDVFAHTGIARRHVSAPLEWYASAHTFGDANDRYIATADDLAATVARDVLAAAGLAPADVDHIVFVSSTGIVTPSIDARLAHRLGCDAHVRRTPLWGLGCAGGVVGLARAADFARADPRARVLMIALELCSLTFQPGDADRRTWIAASLFGDGAAAALVCGADAAIPRSPSTTLEVLAASSTLFPDSLDVMGWTVDGDGLHVVFSQDIPAIVRHRVRGAVDAFLREQSVDLTQIAHIVTHPGGPKVLDAYAEVLERPIEAFAHAIAVLQEYGNMSSPTCLFVLERFLRSGEMQGGDTALLGALGPGFCSELALLRVRGGMA